MLQNNFFYHHLLSLSVDFINNLVFLLFKKVNFAHFFIDFVTLLAAIKFYRFLVLLDS